MIERQFVAQKIKVFQIEEYISKTLKGVGHSHIKMQRTPLGEKIIIFASRPGLIVGRKGANIKTLTKQLKKRFNLENPQIEISEVTDINANAKIVAERISSSLERFGSNRFKGIMHKTMDDCLRSGILGIEIILSGKIPSSRARSWRVYGGYLKKCGDIAISQVQLAYSTANLKTGSIGIKVRLMTKDVILPDDIKVLEKEIPKEIDEKAEEMVEEIEEAPETKEEPVEDKKKKAAPKKKETKKKETKKKSEKKDEK